MENKENLKRILNKAWKNVFIILLKVKKFCKFIS